MLLLRCNAVTLKVEILVANLHRITRFALIVEIVHRALHQKGIFALGGANLLNSLVRGAHHDVVKICHHSLPHVAVRLIGPIARLELWFEAFCSSLYVCMRIFSLRSR